MNSFPLNVYQQVFGLSQASNIVGNRIGTQDELQTFMQTELPTLIRALADPGCFEPSGDTWEVVWGPVVWKNKFNDSLTGPDNSWYLARNRSVLFEDGKKYDTYVVAVGSTAEPYDWLGGEANVLRLRVVDFDAWVAKGLDTSPVACFPFDKTRNYINIHTAGAVHILLRQAAPPNTAAAGLTLHNFISSIHPSDSTKIIFTGHGLGGSVSPTMALALLQANVLDRFHSANVLTYPTAGPTPGNGNFASLFSLKFPRSAGMGYQIWNANIVNKLDIVPQAWCTDPARSSDLNLLNIPAIYGRPAIHVVQFAIHFIIAVVVNSIGITYHPLPHSVFTGTRPTNRPTRVEEFIAQSVSQHILAYENYIGVQLPPSESNSSVSHRVSDDVVSGAHPVISDIGWLVVITEEKANATE